ncbi:uncharacterized protein LOC135821049 isoform X3 [Sycon ciliatum]|uniref:uncharacterized protein LOC135821049 isoform X3 n=1 Tax=Sycon ciliatum TaxID=27933 RepID=UPI0031F601AF
MASVDFKFKENQPPPLQHAMEKRDDASKSNRGWPSAVVPLLVAGTAPVAVELEASTSAARAGCMSAGVTSGDVKEKILGLSSPHRVLRSQQAAEAFVVDFADVHTCPVQAQPANAAYDDDDEGSTSDDGQPRAREDCEGSCSDHDAGEDLPEQAHGEELLHEVGGPPCPRNGDTWNAEGEKGNGNGAAACLSTNTRAGDSNEDDTDNSAAAMPPRAQRKAGKKEVGDTAAKTEEPSLQSAFQKFRAKRQRDLKLQQNRANIKRTDAAEMERLRCMFLERTKHYFGVPYAKRYQKAGTPEYDAPLFLDCCGLVRQVLRDLADEFGFAVGPWNQAYMYDTLPIKLSGPEEMKPGDLVFVSGIYNNPKSRKQIHNMVHVEVWAGDGLKTIGARWFRGKVQVHDSYQYESTTYRDMKYHFCSIDTWLQGVCKSFCETHRWNKDLALYSKHSVFYAADDVQEDETGEGKTSVPALSEAGSTTATEQSTTLAAVQAEEATPSTAEAAPATATPTATAEKSPAAACHGSTAGKKVMTGAAKGTTRRPTTVAARSKSSPGVVKHPSAKISIRAPPKAKNGPESSATKQCEQRARQTDPSDPAVQEASSKTATRPDMLKAEDQGGIAHPNSEPGGNGSSKATSTSGDSSATVQSSAASGTGNPGKATAAGKKKTSSSTAGKSSKPHARKSSVPSCAKPASSQSKNVYCISGGNGGWIVDEILSARGWRKSDDPNILHYRLKWTELKVNINFEAFRAGEQLVNHIPQIELLTTKVNLAMTLREYDRSCQMSYQRGLSRKAPMSVGSFLPMTFNMERKADREEFKMTYEDGDIWICKPSAMNQGKGIELIRSMAEFCQKFSEPMSSNAAGGDPFASTALPSHGTAVSGGGGDAESAAIRHALANPTRSAMASSLPKKKAALPHKRLHQYTYVMQRYITRPLLVENCKFDVRCYMLIAHTAPYIVLFHHGYVRRCTVAYSEDTLDRSAHLTNQAVQRQQAGYEHVKEDTVWSMEHLQQWLNTNWKHPNDGTPIPPDFVSKALTKRMQQIMMFCFNSVKSKLPTNSGEFELLGFDFLIDDLLKVWLLEVNTNPALHTNCDVLKDLIPPLVENTLDIVLEIARKARRGERLLPLTSVNNFTVLYTEEGHRR